jgi:hypothetical protein
MKFLSKLLDDRELSVNPIHVVMIFLVLNAVGWVWYIVLHSKALPELSGIAMLLGGGGMANLAQKAESIVDKFRGKDKEDPKV